MKKHRIFLAVAALFLLLRLSLLFTSQEYLDADEAVVGLMAKHIVEKGERPTYFYGLPYNGGASVEAHVAALLSLPFGLTDATVKASALVLSLSLLVATYLFCLAFLGRTTASVASLLLVTAEPLIVWNLKARGGYVETMLFSILIPWIGFRIFFLDEKNPRFLGLLGFLCGCALWCQEMALSVLGATFLFWAVRDRRFVLKGSFAIFLLCFLLGYSPSLWFNVTHHYLNWRNLLLFLHHTPHTTPSPGEAHLSASVSYAAGFFDIVHGGYEGWPVQPGAASPSAWVVFSTLVAFVPLGVSLLHGTVWPRRTFLYCATFFSLHILSVHASAHRTADIYRYYLPLYPLLSVYAAVITESLGKSRWTGFLASVIVVAVMSGHGLIKNVEFIGKTSEEAAPDFQAANGGMKLIPVVTGGQSIREAVDFLRAQGIRSVITSVYIKYRLIFESGEEIRALSSGILPVDDPYLYYDRLVREDRSGPFAFVFFNASPYATGLPRLLDKEEISYEQRVIREMTVYYPFTRAQAERIFPGLGRAEK